MFPSTKLSTLESPSAHLLNPLEGLKFALLVIMIGVLYAGVLAELAKDWWTEPAWSYGLLIPPVALYVAWIRRQAILRIPSHEDYRGLWVTGGACVAYLLGNLGAEFFITRSSFVLLLVGLTWTFWGLPRLRALAFSFLLLATMVPLPVIVYNALAAPLQLFAASSATAFAQALGVSVYQDGNIINLAHISLGVEEACSGLNSLAALVVSSLLMGFLVSPNRRTRMLVILASVPIAIGLNIVRVIGTALLADHHEEFAQGFYHLFAGWLIFVGGFVALYVFARTLHRFLD